MLLTTGTAEAEPSAAELAAAREIFKEARQAEDAGDWATALRKVRAVAEVKMTAQVRFHLGLCEEKLGFLVEALNNFERAGAEANEQNVAAVAKEAPEHAAHLRARLPHLRFELPPGVNDLSVLVDGLPIAASVLAYPIPLNPGPHTVLIKAADGRAFRNEVTLSEREERTLAVTLSTASESSDGGSLVAPGPSAPHANRNDAVPDAAADTVGPLREAGAVEPILDGAGSNDVGTFSPSAQRMGTEWSDHHALGWIGIGSGGVLLLAAGIAAAVRADAISNIDERCPTHRLCPTDLHGDQDQARTYGAIGLTLGLVGAAAVVGGSVLVLTSRSQRQQLVPVTVSSWITGHGAGAVASIPW